MEKDRNCCSAIAEETMVYSSCDVVGSCNHDDVPWVMPLATLDWRVVITGCDRHDWYNCDYDWVWRKLMYDEVLVGASS